VARYLVSVALVSRAIGGLGLGTLTVNILGSMLLGFLAGWGRQWVIALLAIGFCGGFTTFSTFSLEVFNMLRIGNLKGAALYAVVSMVVCALAVWAGFSIGMKIDRVA